MLAPNREEISIIQEVKGLYQIKFFKVHRAESVTLAQSSSNDDKLGFYKSTTGPLEWEDLASLKVVEVEVEGVGAQQGYHSQWQL